VVEMARGFHAILFDLDGTLIRMPSPDFFDSILVETLRKLRLPPPPRRERLRLWVSGREHWRILKSWGVADPGLFWRTFDEFDLKLRSRLIRKGAIKPYVDVESLENLHLTVPLGLVTNTSPRVTLLEVKSFNLEKYFDVMIALGTERQGDAKPEATGVLEAFKVLGCRPSDGLMVGDSDADVLAGRNAGSTVAVIKRPHVRLRVKPDMYLNSLYTLQKLVDD